MSIFHCQQRSGQNLLNYLLGMTLCLLYLTSYRLLYSYRLRPYPVALLFVLPQVVLHVCEALDLNM